MATFTFFDEFWGTLGAGTHALGSASCKIALSNTAPSVTANTLFADITEITPGNGYTDNGHVIDSVTWAETGAGTGIWQFTSADEVFTAAGGSIGPFRYIVLYNDTALNDPLIGYLDYGSSITVTTGNTFTVDVGANGWFRLGDGTLA